MRGQCHVVSVASAVRCRNGNRNERHYWQMLWLNTLWIRKGDTYHTLVHIFTKYWSISKILSLSHAVGNLH